MPKSIQVADKLCFVAAEARQQDLNGVVSTTSAEPGKKSSFGPEIGDAIERAFGILIGVVAVFWVVEIADRLLPGSFERWGIRPRSVRGLSGIIFAPFIHAGWWHLISNTIPFVILGMLVISSGLERWINVSVISALISGLGVWLLGSSSSVTVGASGVIFGYLGYLLSRGFFERKPISILIGIVAFMTYGGMVWGVLPTRPDVSWQGHLFGFIGGVVAARLVTMKPAKSSSAASGAAGPSTKFDL